MVSLDTFYTINKDIWDIMDPLNKAGLILHELILRDALRSVNGPHESSVRARFFHARLADPNFEKLDLKSYTDLLALVQFIEFDVGIRCGCGAKGAFTVGFENAHQNPWLLY